jgi:hypothetical protein
MQVWAADMDDAEDTFLRLMRFKQNPGTWVPPAVSRGQQGGRLFQLCNMATAGTACWLLPQMLLTNHALSACLPVVACSRHCHRRSP